MPDKFQNKYRITSTRAPWWDYGNNAAYFITICTQHREHYFGEILNNNMQLSPLGKIAEQCFLEIPEHFKFVVLDEFVVMPNHVHAIIVIDKPEIKNNGDNGNTTAKTQLIKPAGTQLIAPVEARLIAPLQIQQIPTTTIPPSENHHPEPSKSMGGFAGNKNPMLNENLSRVLRWYKGRTTFECRKIHTDFGWQSRFHDHIIRDDKSHERIKNYIINNPQNWGTDKFKN